MPSPHIVIHNTTLLLVPCSTHIKHVVAAWKAFAPNTKYLIIPSAFVPVRVYEDGPKQYPISWTNFMTHWGKPTASSTSLVVYNVCKRVWERIKVDRTSVLDASNSSSTSNSSDTISIKKESNDISTIENPVDPSKLCGDLFDIPSVSQDIPGFDFLNKSCFLTMHPENDYSRTYSPYNFDNTIVSLMKSAIIDGMSQGSQQYVHVVVYKTDDTKVLKVGILDHLDDVFALVKNLPNIGFSNVIVKHVFNIPYSSLTRQLLEHHLAKCISLENIVQKIYSVTKCIQPIPTTLSSCMIKFIMERIATTYEFDPVATLDIDKMWATIIQPPGKQPRITESEFVEILLYLGYSIDDKGSVCGLRQYTRPNLKIFLPKQCKDVFARLNKQLRSDPPCPTDPVSP